MDGQPTMVPAVQGTTADEIEHPAWCSPEHCYVTDAGVRVHEQAPLRWADHEAEVLFESRLFDPADDEHPYIELILENLRLTWFHYYGILPLEVAQRLRDQLTKHLDAAAQPGAPPAPTSSARSATVRLTVMNQMAKSLPDDLEAHHDTEESGPEQRKLAKYLTELAGYIRANTDRIPNYGERRRCGETISTSFVESTVNQVVSKRMVKKQQIRWSPPGAHLFLQVRTRVLNNDLAADLARWHPGFTHHNGPIELVA